MPNKRKKSSSIHLLSCDIFCRESICDHLAIATYNNLPTMTYNGNVAVTSWGTISMNFILDSYILAFCAMPHFRFCFLFLPVGLGTCISAGTQIAPAF